MNRTSSEMERLRVARPGTLATVDVTSEEKRRQLIEAITLDEREDLPRRPKARPVLATALLLTVAIIAALAVQAGGTLVVPRKSLASPRRAVPSPLPGVPPAEFVLTAAQNALANVVSDVEEVTVTATGGTPTQNGGHLVVWSDESTHQQRWDSYTASGTLRQSVLDTPRGETIADYPDAEWWQWVPPPGAPATHPGPSVAPYGTPQTVFQGLQGGTLALASPQPELVAGQETLHLRSTAPDPAQLSVSYDVWVNASSYLPVQSQTVYSRPPNFMNTRTFSWEAATPGSLSIFDLEIPSTFRQVSTIPDDG